MSQQRDRVSPATLFYSYAHEDGVLRDELEKHLGLLRRQRLLSTWSYRQIMPGTDWSKAIDTHLSSASIILLLISSDFLNSDYCYGIEMQRALERHQRGEVRVIPIILRPCDWQTSPFAPLQCLPRDGKALTTWENPDEAFLAIAQGLRQIIERQQIPVRPLPEVERQKRRALIKLVRMTWIEGVLEHSLHRAALIALDLQEQPDALANPWRLEVQETNLPPCLLPPGTPIVQVYDKADGELLILGEPGAGKTTLLLELACTLLKQAEEKEQEYLPVVFNLSSWAQGRQSLAVWLVEELWTKYQVPRTVGQAWIDTGQVLPLLDGLDEVAENARSACVQAINAYYHHRLEQGPASLIVCCRSQEYLALSTRVNLHQAVSVQPLTDEQIEHYLQSTRGQLEALRHALRNDPKLYELVHRPLMLSIFTLAYQGAGSENLPTEGTREAVFATYVERMLTRRGASRHVSREPALRWLTFLAAQMQQHHQTVFYLEHLQPDWLVDERMLRKYDWLAVRLPYMLVGVLVSLAPYPLFFPDILTPFLLEVILLGGLLGWLLGGGGTAQQFLAGNGGKARGVPWYWLLQQLGLAAILGSGVGLSFWKEQNDPLRGLVAGLSFGVCCLLLMLLLRKSNTLQALMQPRPQRPPVRGKVVLNALLVGLLAGLSNALGVGLHVELKIRVLVGLFFLLLGALNGGLLSMLLIGRHAVVQPVDRLIWTWQSFSRSLFSKRHVRSTLPITGIGLLLFSAIIWLMGGGTIAIGLAIGLVFGLCYWLLLGFFRGVASTTIDDQLRVVPNQGIRHSALNALRYGLVVAILVGLGGRLLSTTWTGGLIIGLSVGLLAGLFNGGLACLRHSILRILLWRSGAVPWDYPHFLDAVAERLLLHKVRGGYTFLHRLLLDYLATPGGPTNRNTIPSYPITPTALLPCGHESRPTARFCSVCGAAVPS